MINPFGKHHFYDEVVAVSRDFEAKQKPILFKTMEYFNATTRPSRRLVIGPMYWQSGTTVEKLSK